MTSSLTRFQLSDVTRLGAAVRQLGASPAPSTEAMAQRLVRLLYDELVEESGERSCVLARLYVTTSFGRLDQELQAFGTRLAGDAHLSDSTRCMTLLATAGELPEWNDRRRSAGHQTIPLPSEEAIRASPMLSQLITQLGLDLSAVVQPDPTLVLELEQRTYNVFFVPRAAGSTHIPAQEFVNRWGVESVLGFGGILPGGDVFAVLLFTRVAVPRSAAEMFRNIALNAKLALLACTELPVLTGGSHS